MVNVSNKTEENCYGCGACKVNCPKKAIAMNENKRGFLLPSVDSKKCIQCGLCIDICPYKNIVSTSEVVDVYAAKSKNPNILFNSTSGGIFSEIALSFLRFGVVVGAAYTDNLDVEHIIIENSNEIKKIRGSKYVQSNIFKCFEKIKDFLNKEKKVLFSGTGCQIASLKCYLRKEYKELYTIEIACHGVPSPGFFRSYIKYLEKKKKVKIIDFKFRTKEEHKVGEHYKLHAITQNGKIIKKYSNLDPYYGNFLDGLTLRKTCYSCKFKGKKRVGDLLLSDYWGIEKYEPKFDSSNGASAVFVCNDKGKKLFELIKKNIDYANSSFEKATKCNNSIIKSTLKIENNMFDELILIDNPSIISKIVVKNKKKKIMKNLIPEKIKRYIKK